MRRDKKDESWEDTKADKAAILQEARLFNATSVDVEKCSLILTKIIYVILQSERLTQKEATDVFFNMTRLFQSKDSRLRRLTYIGIKELSKLAENVYVVTSSLTADVNSSRDDPAVRASALRALCKISDESTIPSIERYLKQAIVDKFPVVASAALVSSLHLSTSMPEGVKRWTNEIQEALNSDSPMVQYHALGLLYSIRKNDRLAISKLISKCIKNGLRSPFAVCFLIRIITRFINDQDIDGEEARSYLDFIKNNLHHRSETVIYEAANALVNLRSSSAHELSAPVSALHTFLSSAKATLRFAAVRTLNRVATIHPGVVSACNLDLESLITQSDTNRSIATLAITTLLKTGSENSIERFLSQIGGFLPEIDDEFKVVVVASIRQLCQKYPGKHHVMMSFLSKMLREEGGYNYKKAIVDTIINIIEDNEETKEEGLIHLCDFIEDCEHTGLAVKVLSLLGREGPKTAKPSRYTRFIDNRLFLEKSPVECAAAAALAKFGASCKDPVSILTALDRSSLNKDDEVRDRDILYKNILSDGDPSLSSQFVTNPLLQVSFSDLEEKLLDYISSDSHYEPFDIKSVAFVGSDNLNIDTHSDKILRDNDMEGTYSNVEDKHEVCKTSSNSGDFDSSSINYESIIQSIDELASLGLDSLLVSQKPMALTEPETEIVVSCIKHIYKENIVFQFDCTNTMNDQILQQVSVEMCVPEGLQIVASVECPELVYNVKSSVYICAKVIDEDSLPIGTCDNVFLKYIATGDLSDDRGIEDEYQLENFEIELSDFMLPLKESFDHLWNHDLGEEYETKETFFFSSYKTLEEAVLSVIKFLGLEVYNNTGLVAPDKTCHILDLGGSFYGRDPVIVRATFASFDYNAINMILAIRCANPNVISLVTSVVGQ